MILRRKPVSVALGVASLGGVALQAWTFDGNREGLHMAYSLVYTLPSTKDQVDAYAALLPESPPKGGQAFDARPFWQGVSGTLDPLVTTRLSASGDTPMNAEEVRTYLNDSSEVMVYAERYQLTDYIGAFFPSLLREEALGETFTKVFTTAIWPVAYDKEKKKFTTFGNKLYTAYGQSLTAYMNLFHIPTEHRAVLYRALGIIFNKQTSPSSFTGTSFGWVAEPIETLYFLNVDLRIIHLLDLHGDFRTTYHADLLDNLKRFIEMFWIHHLVRFYESLREFNQAQAGTGEDE
ncbi:MAG: hypothetical protein LBD54_02340, partial [Puniceicoccales bacterium]|nr:hypothetical protein [Puniceicoccales bacterium]